MDLLVHIFVETLQMQLAKLLWTSAANRDPPLLECDRLCHSGKLLCPTALNESPPVHRADSVVTDSTGAVAQETSTCQMIISFTQKVIMCQGVFHSVIMNLAKEKSYQ